MREPNTLDINKNIVRNWDSKLKISKFEISNRAGTTRVASEIPNLSEYPPVHLLRLSISNVFGFQTAEKF